MTQKGYLLKLVNPEKQLKLFNLAVPNTLTKDMVCSLDGIKAYRQDIWEASVSSPFARLGQLPPSENDKYKGDFILRAAALLHGGHRYHSLPT